MSSMQTQRKRLERRTDRRMVAGVAGGLADFTDTGAAWWRVGFIFFTLVGGLGVLVYLLLWWLVPRADLPRSAGQRLADHFPDAPSWLGIALLMLGAVLLVGRLGVWSPSIAWGFLLIGLGFVLFHRDGERRAARPDTSEPAPAAAPWNPVGGAPGSAPTERIDPVPPPPPSVPRPPRERSKLGWLTLGVALALGGLLWMLTSSGSAHLSVAQVLSAPLAVLGVGLLVGAFVGRGRWTLLFGLPLIPAVLIASVITVPLTGRWGDRFIAPQTAAAVAASYEQSGGNLRFDFSKLKPGEHPGPVAVRLGVGEIDVLIPRCTPVVINGSAGLGTVSLFDHLAGGISQSDSFQIPGADPIRMNLTVDIGDVRVYNGYRSDTKGGCA
jgi:phage shock protein PspC (stress-responsive transcriptional regulator)